MAGVFRRVLPNRHHEVVSAPYIRVDCADVLALDTSRLVLDNGAFGRRETHTGSVEMSYAAEDRG